nr:serrate RNA effector molecule [Hymenolepis microstoma]
MVNKMGDSDDDLRRSRDKFHRERSDADNRREKREPFDDRAGCYGASRSRNDRRSSFTNNRDKSSFGDQPSAKRPRREHNDDNRTILRPRDARSDPMDDESIYRPPLKPFKRFLEPLDDFITDVEAVAKYNEYKKNFNKQYIEKFFEAHKDEEWLREKYHPDFVDETLEQISKTIRHRLDIFLDLFDKGMIDNQPVELENSKNLKKLMDAVVLKLNGGNDEDLLLLENPEEVNGDVQGSATKRPRLDSGPRSEGEESDYNSTMEGDFSLEESSKTKAKSKTPEYAEWTGISSDSEGGGDEGEGEEKSVKEEENHPEEEEDYGGDVKEDGEEQSAFKEEESAAINKPVVSPREDSGEIPVSSGSLTEEKQVEPEQKELQEEAASVKKSAVDFRKNASIFFPFVPPSITRKELEELCSAQPGFLRLAIADPLPERRFLRRAWATYNGEVDIKKICWSINTNPLLREKSKQSTEEDFSATVNRELTQRIRVVNGMLTRYKPVMQNDLRIASRLVAQLDSKHCLWSLPEEDANAVTNACPVPGFPGVLSANPLMRNLSEFLEEKPVSIDNKNNDAEGEKTRSHVPLETDPGLLRALDRLIIYLRIVYSIDFYAATLYSLEDMMPHQCGIFHVRDSIEGRNQTVFHYEANDYITNFNEKMEKMLDMPKDLTDSEMAALGARDPEKAAEDFIEANTQKRTSKKNASKVVWVCPLSDKKFREPIFVRKHILNKYMDKVEAAKKDNAIFFNNYLRDPKRPSLPEAPKHLINRYYPPTVPTTVDTSGGRGRSFYRSGGFRGGFKSNSGQFGRRDFHGSDGSFFNSSPRGGAVGFKSPLSGRKRPYPDELPRSGGRTVVSYNDLDDPANGSF